MSAVMESVYEKQGKGLTGGGGYRGNLGGAGVHRQEG
jgi:hypothetical protein